MAKSIEPKRLAHIAITMDGNRREGQMQHGDKFKGHELGAYAVENIIRACVEFGIPYLTLYAFSTENWKRSETEVRLLFELFRRFFKEKAQELVAEGVRIKFIGRRDRLPVDIQGLMLALEARSSQNTALTVCIALDYGGRDEIIRAVRKLLFKIITLRVNPFAIDELAFAECLDTRGVPDPDLLIRTSGEQRTSGFLPWQATYAELYFTAVNWPCFDKEALEDAILWFEGRSRRLGGDEAVVASKIAAE